MVAVSSATFTSKSTVSILTNPGVLVLIKRTLLLLTQEPMVTYKVFERIVYHITGIFLILRDGRQSRT